MKTTEASQEMKALRLEAARFSREARTLERVDGMDPAARVRREEADRLHGLADNLHPTWRLENLQVYQVAREKTTSKGETRTYYYWNASWREGGRVKTVYLGSCKKMSEEAALENARAIKAEGIKAEGVPKDRDLWLSDSGVGW